MLKRSLGRSFVADLLILVSIVAVLGVAIGLALYNPDDTSIGNMTSFHARNFTIGTTEGVDYSLKFDLDQKRVIVLDFMATWCKPCLDTGQKLATLQQEQSVSIVSITT